MSGLLTYVVRWYTLVSVSLGKFVQLRFSVRTLNRWCLGIAQRADLASEPASHRPRAASAGLILGNPDAASKAVATDFQPVHKATAERPRASQFVIVHTLRMSQTTNTITIMVRAVLIEHSFLFKAIQSTCTCTYLAALDDLHANMRAPPPIGESAGWSELTCMGGKLSPVRLRYYRFAADELFNLYRTVTVHDLSRVVHRFADLSRNDDSPRRLLGRSLRLTVAGSDCPELPVQPPRNRAWVLVSR